MNKQQFLPRLEALRGFAALAVAAYHMGIVGLSTAGVADARELGHTAAGILLRLYFALFNGFGAVVIFFVLSGFVLARSLDRVSAIDAGVVTRFVVGRLFRLYPAAIATIGIFCALYFAFNVNFYHAAFDPLNIVLNALIVQFDIDGVMWSLKVELAATPVIILCVVIARRYGALPLLAVLAIIIALSFWRPFFTVLGPGSNLAPLHAFVLGIIAHFYGATILARMGSGKIGWLFLLSIVMFCAARPLLGLSSRTVLVESLCATMIVLVVAYCRDRPWLACLDWLPSRVLGRISYSFYLLHPLALGVAEFAQHDLRAAHAVGVPLLMIVVVAAVASVVAIAVPSYLLWRFVEVPGIAWGKWVTGRRQSASAPATIGFQG